MSFRFYSKALSKKDSTVGKVWEAAWELFVRNKVKTTYRLLKEHNEVKLNDVDSDDKQDYLFRTKVLVDEPNYKNSPPCRIDHGGLFLYAAGVFCNSFMVFSTF